MAVCWNTNPHPQLPGVPRGPGRATALVKAGILLTTLLALPADLTARPDIESFLRGYHAARNLNYQVAETAIDTALRADPESVEVLNAALHTYLAAGRVEESFAIARQLETRGAVNPTVGIILLVDDYINNDSGMILAGRAETDDLPFVVHPLAQAWSLIRNGDHEAAQEVLTKDRGLMDNSFIMLFHSMLAHALRGETGMALGLVDSIQSHEALQVYSELIAEDFVYINAQLLADTGNREEALALLGPRPYSEDDPRIIRLMALHDQLGTDTTISFDYIDSADAGLAKGFVILGRILAASLRDTEALHYLQLARALDPDNAVVMLELATILYESGNPNLAIRTLADGPREGLFADQVTLIKARSEYRAGDKETAFATLGEAVVARPQSYTFPYTLGELYRQEERYRDAIAAYDQALARMEANESVNRGWVINFHRAVAHMELGEWEAAEADFRTALDIAGDTPFLLNYLGYSLADRNLKLDEAEVLIRGAVAAEPNNGMYVDSLGWVLYRQGRYEEALAQLELATRLMSPDPVVIDHLGDAYWQTGQENYAYEQWEIALELAEDEILIERIRRKLEVGLDKVLEEEEAAENGT